MVLTFFGVMFSFNALTARQSEQNRPGRQQSWFDESGLKIGDPFPEVSLFDAAGKPFNTKSLKGHYTVLVNGCLT
jgi:cytochrome oxidase Cu insertion factor (SCO1/SenC/PrrC family)